MAKIIELHISTITRKRCFIFYFKNYVQLIGSIIHSREFYLNRNIVNGKNKEYPFYFKY
jgi:hypothetical protein